MKRFYSLILIIFCVNICFAQGNIIFEKRNSAIENLDIFRGSMIDSSLFNMKQHVKLQNQIIAAEKYIIEVYLDSLRIKADSLQNNVKENNIRNQAFNAELDNDKLVIGVQTIVIMIVFVILLLFVILFIVKSVKYKKIKKQITDIDKIKKENQKEIEHAKNEVELLKEKVKKEVSSVNEKWEKEVKNLQAKIDSLDTEKANFEKRIDEKILECVQYQALLNSIKEDCEKEINAIKANSNDYTQDKLIFEKEIQDKTIYIEKLDIEKNEILNELTKYKDMYEKECSERKIFEEKLYEKENNIKNIASENDTSQIEDYIKENKRLKEELNRKDERLEKEIKTKDIIEDELRRLIEELRDYR